jgi:hypothetical protein
MASLRAMPEVVNGTASKAADSLLSFVGPLLSIHFLVVLGHCCVFSESIIRHAGVTLLHRPFLCTLLNVYYRMQNTKQRHVTTILLLCNDSARSERGTLTYILCNYLRLPCTKRMLPYAAPVRAGRMSKMGLLIAGDDHDLNQRELWGTPI